MTRRGLEVRPLNEQQCLWRYFTRQCALDELKLGFGPFIAGPFGFAKEQLVAPPREYVKAAGGLGLSRDLLQ
jgi:hypothetical protein